MSAEPGRLFPDLLTSHFYYGFFYGIARAGPYGHMIKVFQPFKDVARFHLAASQPQVAMTGQQGTLNNPRTFCREKGT